MNSERGWQSLICFLISSEAVLQDNRVSSLPSAPMLSSHLTSRSGHHPPSYTLEIKGLGTTVFLHKKYTGKSNPSRNVQSDQIWLKSPDPLYYTLKVLQCWKEAQPAYHLHTVTPTHILPTVSPVTCLNAMKSDHETRFALQPLSCWSSINSLINKCMWYLWKY